MPGPSTRIYYIYPIYVAILARKIPKRDPNSGYTYVHKGQTTYSSLHCAEAEYRVVLCGWQAACKVADAPDRDDGSGGTRGERHGACRGRTGGGGEDGVARTQWWRGAALAWRRRVGAAGRMGWNRPIFPSGRTDEGPWLAREAAPGRISRPDTTQHEGVHHVEHQREQQGHLHPLPRRPFLPPARSGDQGPLQRVDVHRQGLHPVHGVVPGEGLQGRGRLQGVAGLHPGRDPRRRVVEGRGRRNPPPPAQIQESFLGPLGGKTMDELEHLQEACRLARDAFNTFGDGRVLADSDFEVWSILYRRFGDAQTAYINAYNAKYAFT